MTERSDRSRHCGLSGRSDRSDRSKEESESNKEFCRSKSIIGISCGISPPYPINIKGYDRLRESN